MRVSEWWERFWFREESLLRIGAFRILVMGLLLHDILGYGKTALLDARWVSEGSMGKTWRPLYLFEVLGLQPIGLETAQAVYAVGLVAACCGLLGLFSRLSCAIAGCVGIYWVGLVYSFSKVHHDQVALALTLLFLPFAPVGARLSLDSFARRLARAWRGEDPRVVPERSVFAGTALRFTQLTLAIGYGFSGATKLALAGWEWTNGYTLMGILVRYDNSLSEVFTSSPELCRALSVGTLIVQGTFPLVLLVPATRWFYLPAAASFHLTTWHTMDTGPYVTLWYLLIAYVALERVPGWLAQQLQSGRWRAGFALFLVLGTTALLSALMFRTWPAWALVFYPAPLYALWLRCTPRMGGVVHVDLESRKGRLCAACIDALDWGARLDLRPGGGELVFVSAQGERCSGPAARRALWGRLPLLAPLRLWPSAGEPRTQSAQSR